MNDLLFIADKYAKIVDMVEVKGGGDQYNTGFFKAIRLQMGDSSLNQPYKQHVWTYASVRAIVRAVTSLPFEIIKDGKTPGNAKQFMQKRAIIQIRKKAQIELRSTQGIDVVESGVVYDTFLRPNPYMTKSQLWEATIVNMMLNGGCAWVLYGKDGPIKQGEWPSEIWPMNPCDFELIQDKDMNLVGYLRKSKDANTRDIRYETYQVIWFWKYNPYDGVRKGLAPYDVIKNSAEQDLKAIKFNGAFFDNSADPGGWITIPTEVKEDKRRAIANAWEDRHQGVGKANRTALLMGGAEYHPNTRTQQDMQFQEMRAWNRDETLAGFGVHKMILGLMEDINYASSVTVLKAFWENTVIPEITYIEDVLEARLFGLSPETQGLYGAFDYSPLEWLKDDLTRNVDAMQKLNQMGMPLADIVEKLELDMPIYSWMKSWWAPISLTPQTDGEIPPSPDEEIPAEGEEYLGLGRKVDAAIEKVSRAMEKEKHVRVYIERVLSPVEKVYRPKIKKYWFDLRAEQLRLWEAATKGIRALPSYEDLNSILFDKAQWGETLSDLSIPYYEQAAENSLKQVADELGTPAWNVQDPRIQEVMRQKANKVTKITERFWERLRGTIADGIQASETMGEIATRIRNEFNGAASPARTLMIARTETATAASAVRHINLRGEGVKKHEWADSKDGHVRDDHITLGKTEAVELNHNYMDDLGQSGTLRYPCDVVGPGDQVINCRCVEIPVI